MKIALSDGDIVVRECLFVEFDTGRQYKVCLLDNNQTFVSRSNWSDVEETTWDDMDDEMAFVEYLAIKEFGE